MAESEGDEEIEEYYEEEEVSESDEDTEESNIALSHSKCHLTKESIRHRLFRFFAFYEPTQLHVLDSWLENWKDKEDSLFQELVLFHGPEPNSGAVSHSRPATGKGGIIIDKCNVALRQFLAYYAPDRYSEVGRFLLMWQGNEEALLCKLEDQQALRDYVVRYFSENFPERAHEVPLLLRQWLGCEEDLVKLLTEKRNIELSEAAEVKKKNSTEPIFLESRSKLVQFYRVFHPEKVSEIDTILRVYAGREDALFRSLRRKYLSVVDEPTKSNTPWLTEAKKAQWFELCRTWNPDTDLSRLEKFMNGFSGSEQMFMKELGEFCLATQSLSEISSRRPEKTPRERKSSIGTQTREETDPIESLLRVTATDEGETLGFEQNLQLPSFGGAEPSEMTRDSALSFFLGKVGLSFLYPLFLKNEIDLSVLEVMNVDELQSIGIQRQDAEKLVRNL